MRGRWLSNVGHVKLLPVLGWREVGRGKEDVVGSIRSHWCVRLLELSQKGSDVHEGLGLQGIPASDDEGHGVSGPHVNRLGWCRIRLRRKEKKNGKLNDDGPTMFVSGSFRLWWDGRTSCG